MPGKILVVDDDMGMCKLIAQTLKREGYDCLVAFSGEDGLNAWRSGKPDLILLDIAMPIMTGWDVTKAIRAEELPGEHTPIVIMTAQARLYDLAQDMHDKIEGYLAKPLEAFQIVAQVEKLLPAVKIPTQQAGTVEPNGNPAA